MNHAKFLFSFFLILLGPILILGSAHKYTEIRFGRDCSDWIKLAADANSVPIAAERLDVALGYLERHDLTEGSTGIIWDMPSYRLGPWYRNLKAAQENLRAFPGDATEADTSTALVKLRETLLDHGRNGDVVTVPSGIAFYPHNLAWKLAWLFAAIPAFIAFIFLMALVD